jgi:glycosyltransferase involved in cell wall biosynthesis
MRKQLVTAARTCDVIIVADEGTAQTFRPYSRRVLELFPRNRYLREQKPYDIVYHGSIPRYHLEVCLRVDKILIQRGYEVRWRFIGQLPEMDWFVTELTRQKIEKRFFVTGLIPHDQVAKEVCKAKIGVIPLPDLPKFHNNIPQKLFEFMALGMPVVMSDLTPSRPFVGDGACAFMVPPADYDAYADAIITLLEDPSLCFKMGEEGRRRVEEAYNWERESKKLIDLYSDLVSA